MKMADPSITDMGPAAAKPPPFTRTAVVPLSWSLPAAKVTAPPATKPPPVSVAVAFRMKIDEFSSEELHKQMSNRPMSTSQAMPMPHASTKHVV